jgi:endo-1,4-beta-xylanase
MALLLWLAGQIGVAPAPLSAQPLAQGLDRFLGCSTSSEYTRYMVKYWNQVTPGNDGKWGSVEYVQGTYSWTNLDKIYTYVTSKGMLYKHHTLVWGQQQPGWVTSLGQADQRKAVENWIKAVGERYPKMDFVDVVNEPIHAPAEYRAALGGDGTTGWDWVITSFELARKYCAPGARLLINEYNVLQDNSMTDRYIALINLLKARGLIDGIGIQGHYFEFRSDMRSANTYVYSITTLKSNLERIAAVGLPVYISEFDVDEPDDAVQLAQYQIYFAMLWNQPAVKGITFWGYIEGDVWNSHPYTYLLKVNGAERAVLPWLRDYILKPITPIVVSPNTTTDEVRNPLLVWHPSSMATSYRIQLSTARAFSTIDLDTTVVDTTLQLGLLGANGRYYWRVSALNDKGESEFSAGAWFATGEKTPVLMNDPQAPAGFALAQNFPNPFNPLTTISFTLAADGFADLRVCDLLGRTVVTLVHARMAAGSHQVRFDAGSLKSGTYLYTLRTGGFSSTRKMILVR